MKKNGFHVVGLVAVLVALFLHGLYVKIALCSSVCSIIQPIAFCFKVWLCSILWVSLFLLTIKVFSCKFSRNMLSRVAVVSTRRAVGKFVSSKPLLSYNCYPYLVLCIYTCLSFRPNEGCSGLHLEAGRQARWDRGPPDIHLPGVVRRLSSHRTLFRGASCKCTTRSLSWIVGQYPLSVWLWCICFFLLFTVLIYFSFQRHACRSWLRLSIWTTCSSTRSNRLTLYLWYMCTFFFLVSSPEYK